MNKMDFLKERVLLAESKLNNKIISQYDFLNTVISPNEKEDLQYIFKCYDEYQIKEKEYLFSSIESVFEYLPKDEFEAFLQLIIFFLDDENKRTLDFLFDKIEPTPFFIINFFCLCFTSNEFCARIDVESKTTNRLYCLRRKFDDVESDDILFPSDLLEKAYHISNLFFQNNIPLKGN